MKKNTRNTLLIAAATLALGILLGKVLFPSADTKPEGENLQEMVEPAEETIWTCSMHPQIRRNEPGDCPICGMDLIPLENTDTENVDPDAITMSKTAMQLAQVRTMTVAKMAPEKLVRLNGKVRADERRIVSQVSHIPGRIESLEVNFTGDYVQKGQVIANVYSPELVTAQEELLQAIKIADSYPELVIAARKKLGNWKLSDAEIDKIVAAGVPKETFPIRSDASGYVLERMVNKGDYVRTGQSIYEVANLASVWVVFEVYEADLPWVKRGDQIGFTVSSLPGEVFKAKIDFIDPVIDAKTRVAGARVQMNNRGGKLKPEMFASGTLAASLQKATEAISIPKSAVLWTGKRSVVYVRAKSETGEHFQMREIVLGLSLGDQYLIESGLEVGEEIAVSGAFSIDAAAQLAGKPSMMKPEGGIAGMSGHNHGATGQPGAAEEKVVEEKAAAEKAELSKAARSALKPVFSHYWDWKDALTNDDQKTAASSAEKMKNAIAGLDKSLFSGKSKSQLSQFTKAAEATLQHIPHWKDLEANRAGFEAVSIALIDFSNATSPFDSPVYQQHCPMAFGNKGADWLSRESAIVNPYFGPSMLKCGEVVHEFK
jgi:Cu(I)/Ag(I) efflux system membrane fusion protein